MIKQVLATAAIALIGFAGSTAMAAEATEFSIPASTLTRAQAAAVATHQAQAGTAVIVLNNEATQFADRDTVDIARDAVRAETRASLRKGPIALYVGA
jgi:hypothetical protein